MKKQPYNLESRIDEEITEISKLEIKIWKWSKFKGFKNKIKFSEILKLTKLLYFRQKQNNRKNSKYFF